MANKLLYLLMFAGIGVGSVFAQEPFYKGKTIHVVVGGAPGGGFDAYTRVIARHLPKHIPGNPTVIVQNMPGAGMLIAANHIYNISKPDGLTIGHFTGSHAITQIVGQEGVDFDMRKFEYLGAPTRDHLTCVFSKESGITSIDKLLAAKTPVKMGAVAPGTIIDNAFNIFTKLMEFPIKIVSGYKSTAAIRLAIESGELAGSCWGWDSIKKQWHKAIQRGDAVVVLQSGAKAHPDLQDVPMAMQFAKTDEARRMLEAVIHGGNIVERTYLLPPGTPSERVQTLRTAFVATMNDPDFLADAAKMRVGIDPVTSAELTRRINAYFELPPELQSKLKDILFR